MIFMQPQIDSLMSTNYMCILAVQVCRHSLAHYTPPGLTSIPVHRIGAKVEVKSTAKRLMNQMMMRTGTGESRISVRLRNGRAVEQRQQM